MHAVCAVHSMLPSPNYFGLLLLLAFSIFLSVVRVLDFDVAPFSRLLHMSCFSEEYNLVLTKGQYTTRMVTADLVDVRLPTFMTNAPPG